MSVVINTCFIFLGRRLAILANVFRGFPHQYLPHIITSHCQALAVVVLNGMDAKKI